MAYELAFHPARLHRLPSLLRRFGERLGGIGDIPEEIPAWMVRDIGLPVFGREKPKTQKPKAGK